MPGEDALEIVGVLYDFLRHEPAAVEPYRFDARADAAVAVILDAIFGLPADPKPAIDELLKLSCALELELRSPSAAAVIRAAMRSHPRIAGLFGGEDGANKTRELACFTGGKDVKNAPMLGAKAPEGSRKLGSLRPTVPAHIARGQQRKQLIGR